MGRYGSFGLLKLTIATCLRITEEHLGSGHEEHGVGDVG